MVAASFAQCDFKAQEIEGCWWFWARRGEAALGNRRDWGLSPLVTHSGVFPGTRYLRPGFSWDLKDKFRNALLNQYMGRPCVGCGAGKTEQEINFHQIQAGIPSSKVLSGPRAPWLGNEANLARADGLAEEGLLVLLLLLLFLGRNVHLPPPDADIFLA